VPHIHGEVNMRHVIFTAGVQACRVVALKFCAASGFAALLLCSAPLFVVTPQVCIMDFGLKGRLALVTGSTGGIGRAIALKYAHESTILSAAPLTVSALTGSASLVPVSL